MKERVAKAQRSTAKTSADAYVDLYATRPANTLMTPPVQKVDKDTGQPYFTVRYISQAHPNPPGFIKGTFPDSKFKGESPQDAARARVRRRNGVSRPGSTSIQGSCRGNKHIQTRRAERVRSCVNLSVLDDQARGWRGRARRSRVGSYQECSQRVAESRVSDRISVPFLTGGSSRFFWRSNTKWSRLAL
jgi:hypothetical protein